MTGLHGQLLDVDLDTDSVSNYPIPDRWQRLHLGGRGLGTRILLEEHPAGVDPLGPKNILVFVTGPLTGTGVPGAARHWTGARSPLTGSLGESYAGGEFGHTLAQTGYDGIIVRGAADTPVALILTDDSAHLEDATDLWGSTVHETTAELASNDAACACIGPAGENQAKLAAIINDRNHAAGGRGLGAVMGAKQLKAVVVGGDDASPVADRAAFDRHREAFTDALRDNDRLMNWGRYGTAANVEALNERNLLPTRNFTEDAFDDADQIGAFALQDLVVDRHGCGTCPVRCKHHVTGSFGEETITGGGPEYETIAAFGSLVANNDLGAITVANQRCNEYGLDTIGTGHVIAAAMEAPTTFEWGDPNAILDLIDDIAHRNGLGDALADGPEAAERHLDLPEDLAHIKGAPVGMHDLTKKSGMGLSASVSPRGATHMEGFDDTIVEHDELETALPIEAGVALVETDGKPEAVVVFENARSFVNSLVVCAHVVTHVGPHRNDDHLRALVEAATGRDLTLDDTLTIGARNYTLGKLYALREGITPEHDALPRRLRNPTTGPGTPELPEPTLSESELESLREAYYDLRGWTTDGIRRDTLADLDLLELHNILNAPS